MDESAKENARQWYRQFLEIDEFVMDDFISCAELLGIEIKEDEKDRLLTPTEIAQELNNPTYPSAKSVNILLAANGYQVKLESKQWQATEKGKQFCEVISVNKSHNSGAPVTQLKWRFAIVEKLKTFIEESSAFDF